MIGGVLKGSIPPGIGGVAFQGYNTLLRAVEVEKRVLDFEDLHARIRALEEQREASRWRA